MFRPIAVAGAMTLLPVAGAGGDQWEIAGSAHDFTATGTATEAGEEGVCVYCHVSHAGV